MPAFKELIELNQIIDRAPKALGVEVLNHIADGPRRWPIYQLSLGKVGAPTLAMVAGVHGLERIGCEVVISYLKSCLARLEWDETFAQLLERSRLVFVPIVNPVGVARGTRSNGQGVDLMRNSPLDADEPGGLLYRGHRISRWLPFYRGQSGGDLEIENQSLCQTIRREVMSAPHSMVIDVHSGFGAVDRLWFPYAHSKKPFPDLAAAFAIKQMFDHTYPHHFYRIEPMARQYTLHGDLWDYLYLEQRRQSSERTFIPWTLEMGSWLWVKKNPGQIFSREGVFDPIRPHRRRRILRRHLTLFDFMHRVLLAKTRWWQLGLEDRHSFEYRAMEHWYEPNR